MRLKRTNDENNERERGMYAFWFYLGFSNFPEKNFLSTFGTFLSNERRSQRRDSERERDAREEEEEGDKRETL
jgi:hypothetical protein